MVDQTTPLLNLIQRIRPWQLGEIVKRVARITYEEREIDGLKVWLDPGSLMGHRLLRDGHIEREMTDAILRILAPGDTFLDVGANEGWFSLLAARKVGPTGQVVAVEPQARLWPVILRNFSFNHFARCHLAPVAVGEGPERVEIALAPSVNTGASSLVRRSRFMNATQSVVLEPLDRIAEAHGLDRVKLAKIDVEGYELSVLRSAKRLLSERRIEHLLVEMHPEELKTLGASVEDVARLLRDNGYAHKASLWGNVEHYALG